MLIPDMKHTMLEVYKQDSKSARLGFFSSYFKTKEEYFTDAEKINIDSIMATRREMPVVTSLSGEPVKVASPSFNSLEVVPPTYLSERVIDIKEMLKREPGETEWLSAGERVNWLTGMANKIRDGKNLITNMITRSLEKQASQVIQTGTITLTDQNGNNAYVLNLGKDTNQIVDVNTSSTKWDATGGDPEKDIDSLAQYIADHAYVNCTTLIFGRKAWESFVSHAKIEKKINKETFNMGSLANEVRNHGEIYKGFIILGSFRFNLYVYNAAYESFLTGTSTRYLDEKSVLVMPEYEDLDFRLLNAVYPMIPSESRFANLVPDEVRLNGVRFYNKVYTDETANAYKVQVAARPLCLPVSMDNWGVLKNVCS